MPVEKKPSAVNVHNEELAILIIPLALLWSILTHFRLEVLDFQVSCLNL